MNNHNITPFSFEKRQIRVITDDNGDLWFVLRDLLDGMGSSTTTTNAIDSIKQGLGRGFNEVIPLQTARGEQQIIVVAEPAATYLVARSNTERGRKLNRFIHVELLPVAKKSSELIYALNNFEIPSDLPDMYVYAIREKNTGNIKLGISKDPESRLQQLQTANSGELELVAYRKAINRF
ncbi:BRO family protein, partial [Chromatium okenii]|uniref:BRO-N domain-containing protein n=1 Tax=Chromatium okenii TaxID=61644 RepID=UPI0026F34589